MIPNAILSGYGPHGIWYTPGRIVTANSLDSTFSVVDTETLLEIALLPAGMVPMGAGADSLGLVASCGNHMGESVSIYDLQALAWVRDIPLPGGAIQVPFTPDGQKIVAANGSWATIIDVAKAIHAGANNTIRFSDVPETGVTVLRGPTLDGFGEFYTQEREESPAEPVDVAQALRDARADVLVSYLPVGSEEAQKH